MRPASAGRKLARLGCAALSAIAFGAAACGQSGADAPVPVPLDRVACARCGMLVGDLAFAGELRTRSGEVLFYDDPGCLLLHAEERAPEVAAIWFHAHDAERWLSADEVAFSPVGSSPMGYGLAARAPGPGALDRATALAFAREREAERRKDAP